MINYEYVIKYIRRKRYAILLKNIRQIVRIFGFFRCLVLKGFLAKPLGELTKYY